MKNYILPVVLLFISFQLFGQSVQNIKGQIIDKQSELPLIGATVVLLDQDPTIGTTTDLDGYFVLPNIPLGRYDIGVSYLGYEGITIPNVELSAGKEVYLEIGIEESIEKLDEIVITAAVEKDRAQNELATISARTFSMEEVNRYSGGRSDIGRLVANFAGVSTADDARNDIVIRGNSPTGVLWRLEGVPIPSPNHFSTLGTTGGPVSALNPNIIKNSDFMTSAFPAEYGNALAGVFDLGMRNGNKDKSEYMVQLGAVSGLEFMAEGPINKDNQSSYLVAGRYGFVGLASQAGIPIGTNATPNYQDLSFNINLGNTKAGKFSIFGVGGRSDIDFLHDEVDESDLFAASDEDSYAVSKFGVIGVKHNKIIGKNTYVRTILSGSTSQNNFVVDRYTNLNTTEESFKRITEFDNTEIRTTLSSFINRKFNSRFTAKAGFLIENYDYDVSNRSREFTPDWFTFYGFDDNTLLYQAYVQSQYKLNSKFTLNTGLHAQNLSINDNWVVEPRLALNYDLNDNNIISIGYGLHHQVAPLPILLTREEVAPGITEETNINLSPTRSQHFVLGLDTKLGANWRAKVETYYQYIDQVPVDPFSSSFSLLNLGEGFDFPDDKIGLVNEGTGTNIGMELTLEKFFSDGYYGMLTASFYDSKYKGSDGIERNTAFNNQYVLNLLGGREFKIGENNALTFDFKFTTSGGRYYTPVDLPASLEAGEEVLMENQAYSEQYDPYLRLDVKFGFKINSSKRKLSHHFFFDIQNVTNNENIFANRYNRLTNQVNRVNQLGFFPDFMYRVQF